MWCHRAACPPFAKPSTSWSLWVMASAISKTTATEQELAVARRPQPWQSSDGSDGPVVTSVTSVIRCSDARRHWTGRTGGVKSAGRMMERYGKHELWMPGAVDAVKGCWSCTDSPPRTFSVETKAEKMWIVLGSHNQALQILALPK